MSTPPIALDETGTWVASLTGDLDHIIDDAAAIARDLGKRVAVRFLGTGYAGAGKWEVRTR